MAVSTMEPKQTTRIIFNVHRSSKVVTKVLSLTNSRMSKLTTPFQDEKCLSHYFFFRCIVFLPFEWLQLNFSTQSIKLVSLKHISQLYQLCKLISFFHEVMVIILLFPNITLHQMIQQLLGNIKELLQLSRSLQLDFFTLILTSEELKKH